MRVRRRFRLEFAYAPWVPLYRNVRFRKFRAIRRQLWHEDGRPTIADIEHASLQPYRGHCGERQRCGLERPPPDVNTRPTPATTMAS
eukprot:6717853-Alexandrium_andersonii.AAC.1